MIDDVVVEVFGGGKEMVAARYGSNALTGGGFFEVVCPAV